MDEDDDEDNEQNESKGCTEGAEAVLRDFQYQLKCQFMERGRNLRVTWLIIQSSMLTMSTACQPKAT